MAAGEAGQTATGRGLKVGPGRPDAGVVVPGPPAIEAVAAPACIRATAERNTRDFRCLWCSGVLPPWCSVPVFESGFVVPPLECGHGFGPRVAAGMARGSTVRGPGGRGGFFLPDGFRLRPRVM